MAGCGEAAPTAVARTGLAAPEAIGFTAPQDCAGLARRAARSDVDAAALVLLCPDEALSRPIALSALLGVRSAAEAERLVPRLGAHPELGAIARLLAASDGAVAPTPGDPANAVVVPLDDAVLAEVRHAHAILRTGSADDRTRALGYLALVYRHTLGALGFARGPLPPGARLLAGDALHYTRSFCVAYWQRRVAGSAPAFRAAEDALPGLLAAVDHSDDDGDHARLAVERDQVRRYLGRDDVQARLGTTPAAVRPALADVGRLVRHGLVWRATTRMITATRTRGDVDLAQQVLEDLLDRNGAHRARTAALRRLAAIRARRPPGEPSEVWKAFDPTAVAPPPEVPGPDPVTARSTFARRWVRARGQSAAAAGQTPDDATRRRFSAAANEHVRRTPP